MTAAPPTSASSHEAKSEAEIRRAWALRRAQAMEECMELVGQLRHELGLRLSATGEIALPEISPEISREGAEVLGKQRAETALLSASLARYQGDAVKCRKWTEAAERLLEAHAQPATFSLYFEKARALFFASDYSAALELFLSASAAATDSTERLYSQTNVLLCLEYLGLPFERTLAEVLELAETPASNAEIRDQVDTFQMRQAFRHGKFSVFRTERAEPEIRQAGYYQLWIRQLPYHSAYAPSGTAELEDVATRASRLFYRAFRLRTLSGTTHPDDAAFAKRTELADRAYLWVWRWLCAPDQFPLSKVTATIAAPRQVPDYQWGLEDGCLVANALGWLALFDPSAETHGALSLDHPNRSGLEALSPVLYYERLLIGYLTALRNGQSEQARDCRRELQSHPLGREKDVRLKTIVDAMGKRPPMPPKPGKSPLAILIANLTALVATPAEGSAKSARIVVDLKTMRIVDTATGHIVQSEPMALALQLLRRRGSVRREELVATCFGLSRYEPVTHDSKIFNLLSRLRALEIPQLRFGVKGDLVIAEGRWLAVELHQAPVASRRLRADGAWRALLSESPRRVARNRAAARPAIRAQLPRDGRIRRPELEAWLGKSRATTNRLLAVWVSRNWARAEGGSHQTRYLLDPRLVEILEKEGPVGAAQTLQRTKL